MILNPTFRLLGVLAALVFAFTTSGCGNDEPIQLPVEADAAVPDPNDPVGDDDDTDDDDDTPVTPPASTGIVGALCEEDADCGAGAICITPESDDWLGGGAANGYCSADCTTDATVCGALDSNSVCLGTGESAFCVAGCSAGAPPQGVNKCLGRLDLACDSVAADISFCRPMCRNDLDCGDRVCDVGLGICVDERPEGDPIGAECDPSSEEPSTCSSGVCFGFTETFGVCSGLCNLSTIGCGSESPNLVPDDPGEPICIYPTVDDSGRSDLGQCLQRCNCDGDCAHPGAQCFQLGATPEDAVMGIGTVGVCVNPEFQDDVDEANKRPLGIACEAVDGGMSRLDGGSTDAGSADAGPSDPVAEDASVADGG